MGNKQTEKICTGCSRSSLSPVSEQHLACCPDNNYVTMSNNKQHMKLYTEEEVMKLMLSMKTYIESHNLIFQVKLEQLNPIELPSDEEIVYTGKANRESYIAGFVDGVKHLRDKIQGGNNE